MYALHLALVVQDCIKSCGYKYCVGAVPTFAPRRLSASVCNISVMYIHLTVIITVIISVCIVLIACLSRLIKRELLDIIRTSNHSEEV